MNAPWRRTVIVQNAKPVKDIYICKRVREAYVRDEGHDIKKDKR